MTARTGEQPGGGAMPVFGWREADRTVYATRRQLAAERLAPGGPVVARLIWRGGRREAHLYRRDQAKPKRVMTWPQIEALAKALAARRRCTACGRDAGHCLPRQDRRCSACREPVAEGPPPGGPGAGNAAPAEFPSLQLAPRPPGLPPPAGPEPTPGSTAQVACSSAAAAPMISPRRPVQGGTKGHMT